MLLPPSMPSWSDGNTVASPSACAATWSHEMPFSMSSPAVNRTVVAVRKQPVPRAWSPGRPSKPASWDSPVSTLTSGWTPASGSRTAGRS
jgi:hypothetical protein